MPRKRAICKPHWHWIINRPHIMDLSYPQHPLLEYSSYQAQGLQSLELSSETTALMRRLCCHITNPKHPMYLLSALRKRERRTHLPGSKKLIVVQYSTALSTQGSDPHLYLLYKAEIEIQNEPNHAYPSSQVFTRDSIFRTHAATGFSNSRKRRLRADCHQRSRRGYGRYCPCARVNGKCVSNLVT